MAVEPTSGSSIGTLEAYQLVACTVEGQPQRIDHHQTTDARNYTVTVDRHAVPADGPVHVPYTNPRNVSLHNLAATLDTDPATPELEDSR